MKEENKIIWKGFLFNMLGVIFAIILTFGVNSLWQRSEEKKRTKEMLILVRNELEDNKKIFQKSEKILKSNGWVYQKLLDAKKDISTIPTDTLNEYITRINKISINPLTTSAWQIFQNSDMIQKMTDKELVIRLTDCYSGIRMWFDFISNDYWETHKKMLTIDLEDPLKFFTEVMKHKEYIFLFEMAKTGNESMWTTFLMVISTIDYNLMLLDRHGDYRYDMAEKDNEMNEFLQRKIDSVFTKNDTVK